MPTKMTRIYPRLITLLLILGGSSFALAQSTTFRSVRANDAEFHYIEQGSGETVVFLHGGVGDLQSWSPQFEEFAKQYRAISYSRRLNYPNQNPPPHEPFSVRTEADDLYAFLKAKKIAKAHFVGASIGAYVAVVFAFEHPDMVRSLVLAEPPLHDLVRSIPGGKELLNDFRRSLAPADEAFVAGNDKNGIVEFTRSMGRPLDRLPPRAAEAVIRNTAAVKAVVLAGDAFKAVDIRKLRRIKVPVLVVTGENTVEIHKRVNERLVKLLRQAEAVTISNAGHASNRDNPGEFNDAVLRFLRSTDRRRAR